MSKGLKRFFMICAIAVGAGLIMFVIGFATGGVKSIDTMAERYDWIHGSPGDIQHMNLENDETFSSVDIKGELDVVFYRGDTDTRIMYGENEPVPKMYVKNGVLKVEAENSTDGGVINLSGRDSAPTLEVYCNSDDMLDNINIDLDYGDISMNDISADNINIDADLGDISFAGTEFGNAAIKLNAGDVDGDSIVSRGLHIENDLGSCELSGEFSGTTEIISDSGDVDLYTSLAEEEYRVTADVSAGDCSIGDRVFENSDQNFIHGSGQNTLKIDVDLGDVEIHFGNIDGIHDYVEDHNNDHYDD